MPTGCFYIYGTDPAATNLDGTYDKKGDRVVTTTPPADFSVDKSSDDKGRYAVRDIKTGGIKYRLVPRPSVGTYDINVAGCEASCRSYGTAIMITETVVVRSFLKDISGSYRETIGPLYGMYEHETSGLAISHGLNLFSKKGKPSGATWMIHKTPIADENLTVYA